MFSRKKHFFIFALLSLLFAGLIYFLALGLMLDPKSMQSPLVSHPAQDFEGEWLQGQDWVPERKSNQILSLGDLKGKAIILNFWASWCYSCRQEAGIMEAFWQQADKSQLIVVGIAIQDEPEQAISFAQQFGKTYPLALDVSGKAGINYGISGVPETFFINPEGIIVDKTYGPVSMELLTRMSHVLLTGEK